MGIAMLLLCPTVVTCVGKEMLSIQIQLN